MAGAVVAELVSLVTKVVSKQINLGRNAEGKLRELKQYLELIEPYLRNAKNMQSSEAVEQWLKLLGDAAAQAKQKLPELDKMAESTGNWEGAIPKANFAFYLVILGKKVQSINETLAGILKKGQDLGLQNSLTLASSSPSVKETDPFLGDPSLIVPREDDVSKVVDMLISCSSSSTTLQSLPVVSIVGMAGLGKTTLAKMVLKDHQLKSLLEARRQLWVCVSATFDVHKILCQILEYLTGEHAASFETLRRPTIVAKINHKLEGKSFLLVLDDVWNEDAGKWAQLMACLLEMHHKDKSIILATTRSQKVVSAMHSPREFAHEILQLNDDQCWGIIKAKSFGESPVPHNLEVIGKDIGKKCKGVALVASVIGGTMQNDKTEEEWSLIQKSNLWNSLESDGEIRSVLQLSYDRLGSESLKMCFAYCSIFAEDSLLYKDELIQLWMAADFLGSSLADDRHSQTAWDIGTRNFNTLVSNSLFQDVERDYYGNIISCKMHDTVRSLARSLSKAMALTSDTNSSIDVSSIPHINTIGVECEQQAQRLKQVNAPKLQSVFSEINAFKHISKKCKGLRILKLVDHGNKLPSSVGELKDLRYFDVSRASIEKLPKFIGELQKLQTLKVTCCWDLKEVPKHMENLVELSHLYFDTEKLMPTNIGRLTNLQTLPFFFVGVGKGRGIEEVGSLSLLQGKLQVLNLEHVRSKEEARAAKLNEKEGIYELELGWSFERVEEGVRKQDEDVLEGLLPHMKLKGLLIRWYRGRNFPTWLNNSLPNLTKLSLIGCTKCAKLPCLGHLRSLSYLYIQGLDSVECIDADFYGGSNFSALKVFILENMRSLEEWVEVKEENMFPKLEDLNLNNCVSLRNIPLTNGFPSLEELYVSSCSNLASMSLKRGLPRLQRMIIRHCNEVSDIGDGLSCCKCLIEIQIEYCGNLKWLPHFHELRSLTDLRLNSCNKLCAPEGLECCTALQRMELFNCPKMFVRLDFLERLESLVKLSIWRCGRNNRVDDIIPEQQDLDRVTHLQVVNLDAEHLAYFFTYLHASLESLTLVGGESIKCLPDQKQRLPVLRTLELCEFDELEALPQWLDDLSSLEELSILGCWNLRSLSPLPKLKNLKLMDLPNLLDLPNLSNLKFVIIGGCPKLQSGCFKGSNTDWSKLKGDINEHPSRGKQRAQPGN